MTTLSPMNPEHLNDTDAGIDALERLGLDIALDLRGGLVLRDGLPPGT